MEDWTKEIQGILDRAPTRAMSFSRLLEEMRGAGFSVRGREDWILEGLLTQGDLFKVIPDRLGPWMEGPLPEGGGSGSGRGGPGKDPWILVCSESPATFGAEEAVTGRIRESLRAWGREIDEDSPVAVARWIVANREAEQAVGKILALGKQRC